MAFPKETYYLPLLKEVLSKGGIVKLASVLRIGIADKQNLVFCALATDKVKVNCKCTWIIVLNRNYILKLKKLQLLFV